MSPSGLRWMPDLAKPEALSPQNTALQNPEAWAPDPNALQALTPQH